MSALVIPYNHDYGALELKSNLQRFATRGFLIAAALHFLAIGIYWTSTRFASKEIPTFKPQRVIEWPWPPSIPNSSRPIPVEQPGIKPKIGNPIPVSSTEVDPGQTIAKQREMNGETPGFENGTGEGEMPGIEEGPPPDFVAYEKEPFPLRQVWPSYPEFARRAGVEGTVYVKVWVDKEGKVRKAEVYNGVSDILNEAALDAATKWTFTPALMNNGPVSVWVMIPFRFKLQGQ